MDDRDVDKAINFLIEQMNEDLGDVGLKPFDDTGKNKMTVITSIKL